MKQTAGTHTNKGLMAKRTWIYLAFWVLVTIIFLYDRRYLIEKSGLPNFLICSAVRIGLLIALAWANIRWLIPRYLLHKRYGAYFGWVLLLLVGYLLVQSGYDYYLFGFVLGPGRSGQLADALLYNFTHTSLYLLLTIALKFSIDWYEQKKLLQEMQVTQLQAEINFLRSQVNPHFLFNALNNLYALTLKKSDLAPDVVLKLSELMEYMLYDSNEAEVPLDKEIRYLRNYLELEKLRQGHPADIRLTVTGHTLNCRIAPFLLLPLVENAFKHGISRMTQAAYLHISIHMDQVLEVTIENNHLHAQQQGTKGGIGLMNLKKRLALLYPDQHTLQLSHQAGQFKVQLKITLPC